MLIIEMKSLYRQIYLNAILDTTMLICKYLLSSVCVQFSQYAVVQKQHCFHAQVSSASAQFPKLLCLSGCL